jgi:hypothetical protein
MDIWQGRSIVLAFNVWWREPVGIHEHVVARQPDMTWINSTAYEAIYYQHIAVALPAGARGWPCMS